MFMTDILTLVTLSVTALRDVTPFDLEQNGSSTRGAPEGAGGCTLNPEPSGFHLL
jgi:hypothetical protein